MSNQEKDTSGAALSRNEDSQIRRHLSGFEPEPLPMSSSCTPQRNIATDMQETTPNTQVRK